VIVSFFRGALCATFAFALAVPAAAQTAPHGPVHVSRCDPQHNPGSPGGYTGYVGGYYPYSGRYGWRDPYGSLYYQPPVSPSGTLYIDYRNVTQTTMKTIVFGLVARGHLVAEVRDVGTFSPNAEIRHKFGISPNVFPIGTGLPVCALLFIEYENGTTWKNPRLPEPSNTIYAPH
jgi:hypothetical protein